MLCFKLKKVTTQIRSMGSNDSVAKKILQKTPNLKSCWGQLGLKTHKKINFNYIKSLLKLIFRLTSLLFLLRKVLVRTSSLYKSSIILKLRSVIILNTVCGWFIVNETEHCSCREDVQGDCVTCGLVGMRCQIADKVMQCSHLHCSNSIVALNNPVL